MDEAAMKYLHKDQLIFDGTFGVCSERILMFIAMGINENRKGLPIAIFLFSAPPGAQAMHANYDGEILYELLKSWKDHLEKKSSTAFTPTCVITDTDVHKRNALIRLWANIILLLCKFHVTQYWTNSRKAKVTGKQEDVIKADIVKHLNLLEMVKHEDAMSLIHQEQVYFRTLQTQKPSNKTIKGALLHIMYLLDNWMPEAMWKSWSTHGRKQAAAVLGVELEDVLMTTNHLEHFNGILKRKEIGAWLHSISTNSKEVIGIGWEQDSVKQLVVVMSLRWSKLCKRNEGPGGRQRRDAATGSLTH
ncbi:hypothetical protein D9758_017840 [Tetrapyrgos nigripes]|uniref:MULE transposase domain-containing protein n=1 Tax=Tetrapyrgos nigripes TaxID=182062 RepID=A0A8H5BTU7_9AGAR|nr:hypothetical protein D9758_017840 [Tetrapyrgos nigripes]